MSVYTLDIKERELPMKKALIFCFSTLFLLLLPRVSSDGNYGQAGLPPRGWNSYDSFSWIISEEEFLQNAELVAQRLKAHGYKYVVVDYLWYRKKVEGAYSDSLGFDVIDEWGRMMPDPGRWPSSEGGKGFADVARRVHSMGLKFGIHVMRGISTQAMNSNTPILDITKGRAYEESGRKWYAKDIGLTEKACAWMTHGFMSVNTTLGAGRAFLSSLYHQYADWGVDFVKHDCVFGDDFNLDEITTVSEVLRGHNRSIIYSLSPGTSVTPTMAKSVLGLTNMYRITGDDWDNWKDVAAHFDITRDLSNANMMGARGLLGKSWPDLDMLPLGWLTNPGSNEGPHRISNLTLDEKRTQMTLWSMAKSPLMYGGDMRKLDDTTFDIITNPILLEINSFSSNNKEFRYVTSKNMSWQWKNLEDPVTHLSAGNCMNPEMKGWFIKVLDDDLEQVCWRGSTSTKKKSLFCLYMRKPLLALDEEKIYKQQYDEKVHLLASTSVDFCLDASRNRKLSAQDLNRDSFSPCKLDPNQMWEFSDDGTLKNGHSGLCASVEAKAEVKGIRSWVATGRKGEIYVGFFNLEPEKTVISAKLADLAKSVHGTKFEYRSCNYSEVWSGKDLGQVKEMIISAAVEAHGCVLFVLNCSN